MTKPVLEASFGLDGHVIVTAQVGKTQEDFRRDACLSLCCACPGLHAR